MQRPEKLFWKDVGFILLIKLFIIFALWYAFFSPAHQVKPDALAMQHQITDTP